MAILIQTNLNDIVQSTNERVATLEQRRHPSFAFTQKDYLLSKHLEELGSLVPRPLDYCQDRQEEIQPQFAGVWSRTRCALLGST